MSLKTPLVVIGLSGWLVSAINWNSYCGAESKVAVWPSAFITLPLFAIAQPE